MLGRFEGREWRTTLKLVLALRIQHLPHPAHVTSALLLAPGEAGSSKAQRERTPIPPEDLSNQRRRIENPGPIIAVEGYIYSNTIIAEVLVSDDMALKKTSGRGDPWAFHRKRQRSGMRSNNVDMVKPTASSHPRPLQHRSL